MKNFIAKKYQNIKDNAFSTNEDIKYEDVIDFSIGDIDFTTDIEIIKEGQQLHLGILFTKKTICSLGNRLLRYSSKQSFANEGWLDSY